MDSLNAMFLPTAVNGCVLAVVVEDAANANDEQRFWFALPQTKEPVARQGGGGGAQGRNGGGAVAAECAACKQLSAKMEQMQEQFMRRIQALELRVQAQADEMRLHDMSTSAVRTLETAMMKMEGAEVAKLAEMDGAFVGWWLRGKTRESVRAVFTQRAERQ